MGLGCGTTVVKYILFLFNFLIALGGIALVTLGSIVLANTTDWKNVDDTNPASAAIALIVFGGVVFLISFFGCCGAIRESYCMTMTYATILLIIFIGQVVIAVIVLVNKDDLREKIMDAFGKMWTNPSAPGNQEAIATIQRQFECCGWGSPWTLSGFTNTIECAATGHLQVDCKTKFYDFWNTNATLLGWVAIGVAAVQLVALVFACCLGNNVRNAQRRLNY